MDDIAKLCVGDVSPNGIVSIIDEDLSPVPTPVEHEEEINKVLKFPTPKRSG